MVPESLQVVVVLCQHDATEILYKFTVVVVDCRPGILPYAQILAASFAAVHSTFTLLLNIPSGWIINLLQMLNILIEWGIVSCYFQLLILLLIHLQLNRK